MSNRFSVDIGGTFTDLVAYDDESGEIRVVKGPTTSEFLEQGVARLVHEAVPLDRAELFLHASTVGLNALLERKGARVGLLTTRGFRDILELRRGERAQMFNLLWSPPPPLVPRSLRLEAAERTRADGSIETELAPADVLRAASRFVQAEVECVAVVFLHSFTNPEHELAAEALLRAGGYEGEITLSHRVSGEYREFERTSTTCVDAYVRPRVARYLLDLERRLDDLGYRGELLVGRSGGGVMPFGEARTRAHELLMSGPAAGAVGAAVVCGELGISESIAADVGGTSFDTSLILDGRPQVKYEGELAGMPLQGTWVEVHSIGAGGGSIAYVDGGGLLRAGPQSAGAVPGPACYGRGGTQPTATDAACVLGMLGPGELAGDLAFDAGAAEAAIEPLARQLGLGVDEVAQGILTILSSAMADAIRTVTIEKGRDPRDAALAAYGGAGPLFATLLARELDIEAIVVPPSPGNFSAWGLLCQDVSRSAGRTSIRPFDEGALEAASRTVVELVAGLTENGDRSGHGDRVEAALDLRYAGQEHSLTVPVGFAGGQIEDEPTTVLERFSEQYDSLFGATMNVPVELCSVRATLRTELRRPATRGVKGVTIAAERMPDTIEAFSFVLGRRIDFVCADRLTMRAGDERNGPAIIVEPTATTYLDAGFVAKVHDNDALLIRATEGAADGAR